MARIALIRPASVFSRTAYSVPVTMPVNLAYLAANLRKAGHQVSCIDALGEAIDHIDDSYAEEVCFRGLTDAAIVSRIEDRPDGIGVTAMFSQDWPHVERTIEAVRARFPDVPIILGGEHATAAADHVLASCPAVTMVALGEGDDTIVDFARWCEGAMPIETLAGVKSRTPDGAVVSGPPRPRIADPDRLPWPAWDLFDLEPYFATGEGHGVERGRAMPILATRGCPYRCTFCSNNAMWHSRFVMRRVECVLDEIACYLDRYRAVNIDFFDPTAIVRKDWALEFCAEILRRSLRFTWQLPNGTRAEALDEETLRAMAGAGCTNVTYAPESGSEQTLQEIKKEVLLSRVFASARAAKKQGIFVKCNLIIGFPKETRWDMLRTVWSAVRLAVLGVDDAGIFPFSPYPGSELFTYLQSTGRIPTMDRGYFVSLMGFMDLRQAPRYCEKVRPFEVAFYRLLGMGLFYALCYLLRPFRMVRTARNLRSGRSDTVFEERLFGLIKRWRLEKRSEAHPGA